MTTKTERGMQMYSGTLTVLKRLMMGVLGVLGLSALTAGQVSAQEIPAPDVFNDQAACSQAAGMAMPATPTVVAMGDMASGLDVLLRGGSLAMAGTIPVPIGATSTAGMTLTAAMFPTGMTMHCGGSAALADNMDAAAVAEGYAAVRVAYEDLVAKEKTERTAQQAVDGATSPTPQQLETLQDAKAATAKSLAALNAISMGPIYQAGIDEWRAADAIASTITAWDTAVNDATGKQNTLNGANYAKYVALATITDTITPTLLDNLLDGDGNLVRTQLNAFLGIDTNGNTIATVYHDDSGDLIVPMEATPDPDDPADAMRPAQVSRTVMLIKANLDAAQKVFTVLDEAVKANTDALQEPRLIEARRRAGLIRDQQDLQYKAALADNTDLDPDEDGTQSIATYNAAYQAAVETRNGAETALRAAVRNREQESDAVKAEFQKAASFFDQLVARRMVEQAAADKVVADKVADADTPTDAETEAAANAADAVAAAQKAKMTFEELTSDADNPVTALVQELLKPATGDDAGDDGQALVDAIDTTYDKTVENANAIEELTGEEGMVDANTAAIAALTDEDGPVTMNTENIAANKTMIDANTDGVAENKAGVAANKTATETNATAIATNVEGIAANTAGVAANKMATETNAAAIATNVTNIATNAEGVMTNAGNIMTNADNIATNAEGVMTNAGNIATNVTNIATNAEGVMTNAGNITTNAGNIATNASDITAAEVRIMANEGNISTNTSGIASNKTAIDGNAMRIGELSDDLDVVRAGVAASMALAGMPSIDGRGFAVGLGSFDGETAFAAGFLYSTDRASFKIGVTSSGGETGASVGGAWQF